MAIMRFVAFVALMAARQSWAFVPSSVRSAPLLVREAGGFEWEDPTESFDQGVENPFKSKWKINNFAKLGFAVQNRKILHFGTHFGPTMRQESIITEVRKRMRSQTLFGSHFCRFGEDFGAQDMPPKFFLKSKKIIFW